MADKTLREANDEMLALYDEMEAAANDAVEKLMDVSARLAAAKAEVAALFNVEFKDEAEAALAEPGLEEPDAPPGQ